MLTAPLFVPTQAREGDRCRLGHAHWAGGVGSTKADIGPALG